jgi:signal transduction histidine kinase
MAAMPAAAASTPTTALAATWQRLRQQGARQVMVVALLCLGIALLLNAFRGRWSNNHLVYSYAIGFTCFLCTQGMRLLLAAGYDALRRLRGLAPASGGFEGGWRGIWPATVVATVAAMPAGLNLADWITGFDSGNVFNWRNPDGRVTMAMTLLGTSVSVFALSSLEKLAGARAAQQAAQRLAAENQLRLLQSQLEPHMLFNTLANLRVLIGLDAAQAQAMLDRLIAFLRSTLDASRSAAHPLAAEFERTADYLALMGIRMGPRLVVQLELPPALATLPVPPLLLQPLVENAIKHGLEPQVQGGRIEVAARAEGAELVLTVHDSGAGLGAAPPAQPGSPGSRFGLVQIRERLATLHGNRASLVLAAAPGGGTTATIRMPLPRPEPDA